ncbi:MAG: hypothetical protein ACHQUB_00030 [Candidatus Saccharimonadia bacterium]
MRSAIISALVVFLIVLGVLSVIERIIHKLRHNPDKDYRWGVWLFAILAGLYVFVTALGH